MVHPHRCGGIHCRFLPVVELPVGGGIKGPLQGGEGTQIHPVHHHTVFHRVGGLDIGFGVGYQLLGEAVAQGCALDVLVFIHGEGVYIGGELVAGNGGAQILDGISEDGLVHLGVHGPDPFRGGQHRIALGRSPGRREFKAAGVPGMAAAARTTEAERQRAPVRTEIRCNVWVNKTKTSFGISGTIIAYFQEGSRTHHQPYGWSPALEKGGYPCGPVGIVACPLIDSCVPMAIETQQYALRLSALYKGGGPLRLSAMVVGSAFPYGIIGTKPQTKGITHHGKICHCPVGGQ